MSAVFLGAVIWWASRQPAPRLPSAPADVAALLAAVAIYAANTVLRAERWRRLLVRQGALPSFADALALTVVGYMGNNVLPARAGDVLRVVLGAPRAATGRREVVGSLLAERLLDIALLLALFLVLAVTLVDGAGLPSGTVLAVLGSAAAGAAGLLAVAGIVLRRRGATDRVRAFLAPILAPVRDLRGRHGASMLGLTALVWILEAGVWGTIGIALGLDPTPLEALYLVALASIFSLIPSGPGYAGTQDAAAVVGVKAIGGSGAVAVGYLILVRFVLLVPITVIGLVVLAVRYGGLSRLTVARA